MIEQLTSPEESATKTTEIQKLHELHKKMISDFSKKQEQKEMEERITNNVLKNISIEVSADEAIKNIKVLDSAIKNLGKEH